MNKKVYIAGKITGDSKYWEKFAKVAGYIQYVCNDIPLNPAILPKGMKPKDYMRICFAMIDIADIVVYLPDSGDSAGATVELDYCRYIGKPTWTFANYEEYSEICKG